VHLELRKWKVRNKLWKNINLEYGVLS
jgi:hypothetical protein